MLPDVVIPVKDRLDLTEPLVNQLAEQGGYDDIFIFDNGSGPETKEWLADQTTASVVDAEGWNIHEMWNCGLDMSDGPVTVLNNDLRLGEGFLTGLAAALVDDPSLAAICPNYDNRPGTGVQHVEHLANRQVNGIRGLAGFAFMLAADWADTYRFPEELVWWYGDNHLIDSIVQAGRKAGVACGVSVEHIDGGSQTGGNWRRFRAEIQADRRWYKNWRNQ